MEIVPFLLDFILSHCTLKTSQKLGSFEPIVGLICYLVRFSLTPMKRVEHSNWKTPEELDYGHGILVPNTLNGYNVVEQRENE